MAAESRSADARVDPLAEAPAAPLDQPAARMGVQDRTSPADGGRREAIGQASRVAAGRADDEPVESAESVDPVQRYRQALPAGELEQVRTTSLDRAGVPAWALNLRVPGGTSFGGLGYGVTDDEALTGAYGELTEDVRSRLALAEGAPLGAPRRQASYVELVRERGADRVQDPRTLGLPAGVDYDDDRPLQWLPMTRLGDGADVLVPAEFVASAPYDPLGAPPPGGWLAVPVTNGLGAGLDRERAVAHGLLEVLQRDGNGLVFRALDRGVVLDVDDTADPVTRDLLTRLRAAGIDVLVKLAGTDFGVPNVYAVGVAPDDDVMVATAAGEAAHPDREHAVRKAVLEFASARARKAFMHGPLDAVAAVAPPGYLERVLPGVDPPAEEPRVLAATVEWLRLPPGQWRPRLDATVLSRRTTVRLADLPTAAPASSAQLLDLLLGRLATEGFDVLVADLRAPAAGPDAGVHAAKVVVPGLEVETVAYRRLGERNVRRLLDLGRDDLVSIGGGRRDRHGWVRVHLTAAAQERLGGPAWLDPGGLDRAVAGLLPLYREPGRHAAQLALARAGWPAPDAAGEPTGGGPEAGLAGVRSRFLARLHARRGIPMLLALADETTARPVPGRDPAERTEGERQAALLELYRQQLRPGAANDDPDAVEDALAIQALVHGPLAGSA